MPVMPPIKNVAMNPKANFIGRVNSMEPAQAVAIQLKNLIPVGTAISIVMTMKKGLLGFDVAVESPPPGDPAAEEVYPVLFGGVVMVRGGLLLGLRPVAPAGDRFDEDRVGSRPPELQRRRQAELDEAVRLFDERGVPHGEIKAVVDAAGCNLTRHLRPPGRGAPRDAGRLLEPHASSHVSSTLRAEGEVDAGRWLTGP
jgi:glyoxylase I family protein